MVAAGEASLLRRLFSSRRPAFRLARILIYVEIGLALLGVPLAENALHPLRFNLTQTGDAVSGVAARASAVAESVSINAADNAVMRASWFTPRQTNGRAVMLLHGVSDSRLGQLGFAEFFLQHGYAVLAIDSRAHGVSGGPIATYGVLERDDMRRWAEWIGVRAPGSQLYGMGMSMGAAILIQSVPLIPGLRAIIAECPFSSFHAVAYDRFVRFVPLPSFATKMLFAAPIETGLVYARLRYGISLYAAQPERSIAFAQIPILLIHGQEDVNIPPEHSERLLKANPGRVTLWRVPHAGHLGAWAASPSEFEKRTLTFFDSVAI